MAEAERKTAKYRFLVETIKEKIKNGAYAPGERMESENRLSEEFGYSRQTVRQALSVLEREGLIERRLGNGTYISTESRRPARGSNVAIVTTYISDYIFPTIIRGIEETLTGAGYSLTLGVTNNHVEDESRILQSLISRKIDGVIVEGTKTAFPNPNVELYRSLSRLGVDVIASGGVSGPQDIASLRGAGVYGAIIGKAYYTGALSIEKALEVAQ